MQDYQGGIQILSEYLEKNGNNLNEDLKNEFKNSLNSMEKSLATYKNKEKKMFTNMFK